MKIHFKDNNYEAIDIPDNEPLYKHINSKNSPILFGCRTGHCGLCLKKIKALTQDTNIQPPNEIEEHALDVYTDNIENNNYRLLCQISVTGEIEIE